MKALHAFEAAARHASFTEAAQELSLTPGAVGYQVKQLETGLGVALFHRRTRQIALTTAGESLYRTAHRLFRELDEEVRRIVPQSGDQVLTVAVSTFFVTRWLSCRLGIFLSAEPDITLRLQHSVNDPDFSLSGVDLAICWGDGNWPGSQAELLVEMPMIAVCAPALLPALRNVQHVREQVLLHDQPGIDCWPEWLQKAGLDPAQAVDGAVGEPVIVDPNVRVQSAIDGHGLVLANPLIQPEIDAGELVEPFDIRLHGYGYYLVYQQQAELNPAFSRFRQWLRGQVDG